MKRKKLKITGLTLTLLLLLSTAAYAYTVTAYSRINTGLINMGGYSVTATDAVVEDVQVTSWFYRDDTLVDFTGQSNVNATWAQADVSGTNLPGDQSWSIQGYHYTKNSNETAKTYTTYDYKQY